MLESVRERVKKWVYFEHAICMRKSHTHTHKSPNTLIFIYQHFQTEKDSNQDAKLFMKNERNDVAAATITTKTK